ncbi:U32 family peptidase, partial [Mycobacterium tuberculosis]|nr:U32 family peptidase [Mycobacterium tuberculosis]
LFEDPVSLNAAGLIAAFAKAGVTALKIEGRQRGKGYVAEVVKTFRAAVDAVAAGREEVEVARLLAGLVEGGRQTSGAYKKTWR